MKGTGRILVLLVSTLFMAHKHALCQDQSSSSPAHVRSTFQFKLSAPLTRAAPLFGPEGERCWAGEHWNPEFLYPQPAKDIAGAVFTVQHGSRTSVWVNTLFDLAGGRMQYVSFIPDALVSTIDVRLTALDPAITGVEVTYTRTALSPAVNDHIHALATSDRTSGPHWQEAIQTCLEKQTRP
ncbi:MAG TPA: hypothetical protein VHZ07_04850 [Bryobacteraceae bacterium]|jgi:hypothetical protein|nr:hypothetical protein [Bryobacteraceae bacterium]